ncbi:MULTISPECIES: XRE family transcriptional regulator [Actinosynnema]|uniref:XRE family transcriptional regulator n=1 Tax=Actinosynnema TaxID=40566 RepID=UPI0020A474EC|nr:XRE family transcriptional regulator [Actinosynnema pretiosum]MCP2097511.1 hypothetical protein [Actinosynnema pretiosum]
MAETPTLAQTIDKLFKTIKRPDGREHSMEAVAKACTAWLRERDQGKSFSKEYMRQLRSGAANNPTKNHLEALAAFFDVAPAIFLDSESSRQIQADLELVAAVRDTGVQAVALRALSLSPANRAQILEIMRTMQAKQAGDIGNDASAAESRQSST